MDFTFDSDGIGYFQFGLVQGRIDYKIEEFNKIKRLEFTWEGQDEDDEALGRGWAILKDDYLEGKIYFHLGETSTFKAIKQKQY